MNYLKDTLPTIDSKAQKFLDQAFVEETGLPSLILMEQAAQAVSNLIIKLAEPGQYILYLAGAGNNGGDAWASARQLLAFDFKILVLDLFPDKKLSADTSQNKQAYIKSGGQVIFLAELDLAKIDFVIDGIMGTGFNVQRSLSSDILNLLNTVNIQQNICRIAIDVPTGVESASGNIAQVVFAADYTVTFSALKTGIAAEPGCIYSGNIILAPLSMSNIWLEQKLAEYQKNISLNYLPRLLNEKSIRILEQKRSELSHKGSNGKTLLLGGSAGMAGAIILAMRATHATGVGYSYVRTTEDIVADLLKISPESLISTFPQNELEWLDLISKVDCVALGPGGGKVEWLNASLDLICSTSKKLLIDADGLNYLASISNWEEITKSRLKSGRAPAVLTPHPGEYERLAPDLSDLLKRDRQVAARVLAERSSAVIVLKGHATVIGLPTGETYINTSGNQGLAKAGSGDVLTGLAAGFMAQLENQAEAIALAVYFHGLLGDLALPDLGVRGVTPSKLLDYAADAYDILGWGN